MLFLLVSIGPQVASGIGGMLAEQFTSNLGTPSCAAVDEAGSQPDVTDERAKKRTQRAVAGKPATRARDATGSTADADPCAGR